MRTTLRAVLALALLCGFYLLAVGVIALFAVSAWVFTRLGVRGGSGLVVMVVTGLVVTWTIGSALVLAHRRRPPEDDGLAATPEEQPELWGLVRRLAAEVGTRPPDEIRLVPVANAHVTEDGRFLGLLGGTRRMGIGVPLLLGMTRDQLNGVLCHELGHYAGRHLALGPVTYRGLESVHRVVRGLGATSRVGRVFGGYARLYLRVSLGVARAQELEADRVGAAVAGRDAMIGGLRELPLLAVSWEAYLARRLAPAARIGLWPTDLASGYLDYLEHPSRAASAAALRNDTTDRGTGLLDTHPSLVQRVALLGTLPPGPGIDDGTPAYAVLADPDTTMAAFAGTVGRVDRPADLRETDWEEAGPAVDGRYDEALAWLLVDATSRLPHRSGRPVSLADVVSEVRSGRAAELGRRVSSAETSWDTEVAAARVLTALLRVLAVETGRARYAPDWSGNGCLVDLGGTVLDVHGLAERAVASSAGADEVLAFARFFGIPETRAIVRERPEELVPRPTVVAAIAPVRTGLRSYAVVVCTHGIALVRPRGVQEVVAHLVAPVTTRNADRFVDQVLDRPLEEVLAERGAEVLAWDRIVRLHVRRRLLRESLMTITLDSGEEHRMCLSRHTGVTGEPWGYTRHQLGARLSTDDRL